MDDLFFFTDNGVNFLGFLGWTNFEPVDAQEAARALLFSAEISRLQGEQEELHVDDNLYLMPEWYWLDVG